METQDWVFIPLVLATVEAIKRHVPTISGWKTLVVAALVCVALVVGDRLVPEQYNVVRQLFTVFVMAIGGNAYASQLASKLGLSLPSGASDGFPPSELPTRRDAKTLPPKGNPDESP